MTRCFVGMVAQQPVYNVDRDLIDLQSGAKVALIPWEALEDFQAVLAGLQTHEEMGRVFGMCGDKAYRAVQSVR